MKVSSNSGRRCISICIGAFALALLALHADAQTLSVTDAVIVTHDDIKDQWGAHTFNYAVEGETGIFTSGNIWQGSDISKIAVIGQYPKPGSSLPAATVTISYNYPENWRADPPHIIRTPDGYLHIFSPYYVGTSSGNPSGAWGRMKYYRSQYPEDIRYLLDKTSCLGTMPSFHPRTGFGINKEGTKIGWQILTENKDGYRYNTPILYRGTRSGLDFVFSSPVKWNSNTGIEFFYPQVIVNDYGYVLVGQIWSGSTMLNARLYQLNTSGTKTATVNFSTNGDYIYDVRPLTATDFNSVTLTSSNTTGTHRVRVWDSSTRTWAQKSSFTAPTNPGRLFQLTSTSSVFLHNPYGGNIAAVEGDLLRGGSVTSYNVSGATPITAGYLLTGSGCIPNLKDGSVIPKPGEFYYAIDAHNPGSIWGQFGPTSYLLYRMETSGPVTYVQDWDQYDIGDCLWYSGCFEAADPVGGFTGRNFAASQSNAIRLVVPSASNTWGVGFSNTPSPGDLGSGYGVSFPFTVEFRINRSQWPSGFWLRPHLYVDGQPVFMTSNGGCGYRNLGGTHQVFTNGGNNYVNVASSGYLSLRFECLKNGYRLMYRENGDWKNVGGTTIYWYLAYVGGQWTYVNNYTGNEDVAFYGKTWTGNSSPTYLDVSIYDLAMTADVNDFPSCAGL